MIYHLKRILAGLNRFFIIILEFFTVYTVTKLIYLIDQLRKRISEMFPIIGISFRGRPNTIRKALTVVTSTYVTDSLSHHISTGYRTVNCTLPLLASFNFNCSLFAVYFRLNFVAVRCSTALHHQMTRPRSINASILGQLDRSL